MPREMIIGRIEFAPVHSVGVYAETGRQHKAVEDMTVAELRTEIARLHGILHRKMSGDSGAALATNDKEPT